MDNDIDPAALLAQHCIRTGWVPGGGAKLRPSGREMRTTMNAVRRAMIRAVTGSPHVIFRR
jgi:hypothetical protein